MHKLKKKFREKMEFYYHKEKNDNLESNFKRQFIQKKRRTAAKSRVINELLTLKV